MESDIRIISGTAHPELAEEICRYLGVDKADTTVTQFPDGETSLRLMRTFATAMSLSSNRPAPQATRA